MTTAKLIPNLLEECVYRGESSSYGKRGPFSSYLPSQSIYNSSRLTLDDYDLVTASCPDFDKEGFTPEIALQVKNLLSGKSFSNKLKFPKTEEYYPIGYLDGKVYYAYNNKIYIKDVKNGKTLKIIDFPNNTLKTTKSSLKLSGMTENYLLFKFSDRPLDFIVLGKKRNFFRTKEMKCEERICDISLIEDRFTHRPYINITGSTVESGAVMYETSSMNQLFDLETSQKIDSLYTITEIENGFILSYDISNFGAQDFNIVFNLSKIPNKIIYQSSTNSDYVDTYDGSRDVYDAYVDRDNMVFYRNNQPFVKITNSKRKIFNRNKDEFDETTTNNYYIAAYWKTNKLCIADKANPFRQKCYKSKFYREFKDGNEKTSMSFYERPNGIYYIRQTNKDTAGVFYIPKQEIP